MADLRQFPLYAPGEPPDVLRYNAEVDNMDELTVPHDEVLMYGGGICCTTMLLVRDPGPRLIGEGTR